MTLRVALDATPLVGRPTGVGEFVRGVLPHLSNDDVEVAAYGLTLRGVRELNERLPEHIGRVRLPMPAGALLTAWERFERPSIELWTGRVDVLHGTNFVVPPSRRAASVVTVHDLTAVHFPGLCTPTSLRYPDLVAQALDRGAHVHCPSSFVAAEVRDFFKAPEDRVHAILHGSASLAQGAGTDAATGRRLAGAAPYVLAIGTIEPRKNYPYLVQVFEGLAASNSEVNLVIAGARGWGSEATERAIERSRFKSRIKVLGWVSDETRAALLRGADVLAFPSLYEGFGLPPLEAMQEGVPVVAAATGAVPEVVGDGGVLIPPDDADAFAASLGRILDDEHERNRLIRAGRARSSLFSWGECASALVSLYKSVAVERS